MLSSLEQPFDPGLFAIRFWNIPLLIRFVEPPPGFLEMPNSVYRIRRQTARGADPGLPSLAARNFETDGLCMR